MASGNPLRDLGTNTETTTACSVYQSLLKPAPSAEALSRARDFLKEQLELAHFLPDGMPCDPDVLGQWMEQQALRTGKAYEEYLTARKTGEPRRYFSCRSHALSFLQAVAPTKLVDGAWLYGMLDHWQDHRFYPLIRTYLEELGDGDPAQNHVVLYRRLLQENDCEPLPELDDDHYTQGAIQLALAHLGKEFIPEVLGYNLGYEQLPLHLLITAFELNELDIDPYYFTLHVTIDNASTGHARKAVQTVLNAAPLEDTTDYWERVSRGMRLNDLGVGSTDVIAAFDLEHEVAHMLQRKAVFGRHVHSDYCSIGGRTVNDWLAKKDDMPQFLEMLQERGWIKRHEDPTQSRFWRLIAEPGGQMFGVFSSAETQLLYDWIAGNGQAEDQQSRPAPGRAIPRKTFKRRRSPAASQRAIQDLGAQPLNVLGGDSPSLQHTLAQLPEDQRMQRLISLMAPSVHETAEGLEATQLFAQRLA